jgi:low-density lipoprotein receptor class B
LHYIRRFLAAAGMHARPARQDNAPATARTRRRRAGTAVGITALGALVLTGAPAVAASAAAGAATAQATAGTPQIYWTDGVPGTIGRANIDGTGVIQNLVEGGSQPHGVAVDAAHIYWTNVLNTNTGAGTIGRANLDGTGVDQNFITGVKPTGGLAVDGGHLYWGNQDDSRTLQFGIPATIARASLDGSGVDPNFITGADTALGIALDSGHIYWTNGVNSRSGAPASTAPAPTRTSSPSAAGASRMGSRATVATSTGSTPAARSGAPASTAPASSRSSSMPGLSPTASPSMRGTCTGPT